MKLLLAVFCGLLFATSICHGVPTFRVVGQGAPFSRAIGVPSSRTTGQNTWTAQDEADAKARLGKGYQGIGELSSSGSFQRGQQNQGSYQRDQLNQGTYQRDQQNSHNQGTTYQRDQDRPVSYQRDQHNQGTYQRDQQNSHNQGSYQRDQQNQ